MRERKAAKAVESAQKHGITGGSDDSTHMATGGKKNHVVLLNTAEENETAQLRPSQWCAGIPVPIDGTAESTADANLDVLSEYGIKSEWLLGWCADNCNAARDVSQLGIVGNCLVLTDFCCISVSRR